MKILITNDDGFDCEGIQILAKYLQPKHDVWIVAPHKNRSGVSHGLTMSGSLQLKKQAEHFYTYSGLPVDCVSAGLKVVMKETPDVVLSGINRGYNLGTDIIYSGTAAAARQAAILGVPGIAISLEEDDKPFNWKPLCEFVRDNLETLVSIWNPDVFININAPRIKDPSQKQRAFFADLSNRFYDDSLKVFDAPDGYCYTFFEGGEISPHRPKTTVSDYDIIQKGDISVSCVSILPKCFFPNVVFNYTNIDSFDKDIFYTKDNFSKIDEYDLNDDDCALKNNKSSTKIKED